MDNIDYIVNILKENSLDHPDETLTKELKLINQSINGTRKELEEKLKKLSKEKQGLFKKLIKIKSFEKYKNETIATLPEIKTNNTNTEEFEKLKDIKQIHKKRIKTIYELLKNAPCKYKIKNGHVKSVKRAKQKAEKKEQEGKGKRVPDLTRIRIIVENIDEIYQIYKTIIKNLNNKILSRDNFYKEKSPYNTNFKALIISFTDEQNNKIGTEIQILTKESNAVSKLNHPFEISKILKYPNKSLKIFTEILLIKVAIHEILKGIEKDKLKQNLT